MLLDLHIQDFVLIDELDLSWDKGFTVLTGETGAGKSIVIDALSALLGGRVSAADVVRGRARGALIEATFSTTPATLVVLAEMGVRHEDDVILLSREISQSGRSRCRINGQLTTLGALQRLGSLMVDIHSQHEHQWLLSPARQLEMLDALGGPAIQEPGGTVQALVEQRRSVKKQLAALTGGQGDLARRVDLLQYQIDEIEGAGLREGEEEELEQEISVLAHAEELKQQLETAYRALYESEGGSAADQLGRAVASLGEAARIDARTREILAELESIEALIAESARELRYRKDEVHADPDRLARAEERLSQINRLKRKYGNSVREILTFCRSAEQEMEELIAGEERRADLGVLLENIESSLLEAAWGLHEKRLSLASRLEAQVEEHLLELGMTGARFGVQLSCRQSNDGLLWQGQRLAVGERGFDSCEFLFSANPGEECRPLARVASGGELSRVMLALKAVLAATYDVPALIFDEVDAGIGGRTAAAVARKLSGLALEHQVICVTHLPQIAALAQAHILIEKTTYENSTRVSLRRLPAEERVLELARMLDGTQSPTTLAHARQMLAWRQKGAS